MTAKDDVIALGLTLLLDAGAISGSDGDAVSAWADESGEGNDFSQSTPSHRPVLKKAANGINERNVVRFDGSDDLLYSAAILTDLVSISASTRWVVFRAIALNTNVADIWKNDCAICDNNDNWGVYFKSAAAVYNYQWDWDADIERTTSEAITLNSANIMRSRHSAGKIYHKLNTNTESAGVSTSNIGSAGGYMRIGSGGYDWAVFTQIDIAEIIVADRAMSAGDMAVVDAYLTAKYMPRVASRGVQWIGPRL